MMTTGLIGHSPPDTAIVWAPGDIRTKRRTVHPGHEREYVEYVTAKLPGLLRIARMLCRDAHRADDVVQNMLAKLYTHWKRAAAAEDIDAYVRTMLVRSFLNEQRLAWAKVRLFGSSEELPRPAAVHGLPDVETRELVHTALSRVAPRQRAVLVLRFLCDLPVAEVARMLGCAPGTVTSLTSHGLKRLRKLLGAQDMAELEGGGRDGRR